MLGEPKIGLEHKSPLDFLNFLVEKRFPTNLQIVFSNLPKKNENKISMTSQKFLQPLRSAFLEMEMKQFFITEMNVFEMRKFWIEMENIWNHIPKIQEERFLYIYNGLLLFDRLAHIFSNFPTPIWENLSIQDIRKDYPSLPVLQKDDTWMQNLSCKDKNEELPNYPSHICKTCLHKNRLKLLHFSEQPSEKCMLWKLILDIQEVPTMDFFVMYLNLANQNTLKKLQMN
jgi:hypothetical protein